ncbi:hypothetical protein [Agrobacterium rosae]|uniref:Uncharacterized protein n=1 Tax=Agrobacterium rosae TaxID=1972867 RepID=A0AAW9FM81_9HYPH|nr:hypothetical protein [Agrobacterium rosae]MDX8305528.1 hypothetical protein [Agrobacterium rosae]
MKAYLPFITGCFIGALVAFAATAIFDIRGLVAALNFAVVTPLAGGVTERLWRRQ